MTEKAKINLTALDFFEIRENLKNFLKNKQEFTDYNFEGSNLSILLDLLAYNSQNNAYLANMIANESEIDSAILRSNVVSRAKLLGYTPKSSCASRAIISIKIHDPSRNSSSLLLPRGTRFIAKTNEKQFVFVTLDEYNLFLNSQGFYQNDEIEIFEGKIKSFSFNVEMPEQRFILPSTKIDIRTLKIAVFENSSLEKFEIYERANGIYKIESETKAFWIYETDNNLYEIKFGDDIFGKKPPLGSIIYCEYLETNGSQANNLSNFSLIGTFEGYENADIFIKTMTQSAGGAEQEKTSSIKINAPRFYQSQNRALTTEDYIAVTNDIYPYAKSIAVWGGEELNPPKYGKVFISIIPRDITKLTTVNKRDIERQIKKRAVAGIDPVLVDPKFINLNMIAYITIRKAELDNSPAILSKQIRSLIENYFENKHGIFDSDFYYSNLITDLKNFSKSIINVNIDFTLSLVNSLLNNVFSFENEIRPDSIRSNKLILNNSSSDYKNIEDKEGILFVDEIKIGNVDYEKGEIVVNTSLIKETIDGPLEIFVTPSKKDIEAGFASALILNKERLSIELRGI